MTRPSKKSVKHPLDPIYRANPGIDFLHADLHDEKLLSRLKLPKVGAVNVLEALKQHQRLRRVEYVCNSEKKHAPLVEVADKLQKSGLHSANAVAAIPEHRFVRRYAKVFGQEENARRVHRAAKSIAQHTMHLMANIHQTTASPHFRSMPAANVHPKMAAYFENLPGYNDLFGSLNYIGEDSCNSIFSPAAYFLDLMRITGDYITDVHNNETKKAISPKYLLNTRRPDLFDMSLDCDKSFTQVPYLQIVNEVMEKRLALSLHEIKTGRLSTKQSIVLSAGSSSRNDAYKGMTVTITNGRNKGQARRIIAYNGRTKTATLDKALPHAGGKTVQELAVQQDVWPTMAVSVYPFNLPFNHPLSKIRTGIAGLGTSLAAIYKDFVTPVTKGSVAGATEGSLQLDPSSLAADNAYNTMALRIIAGKGVGQVRTVEEYSKSNNTVTLDHHWVTVPDSTSKYEITDTIDHDLAYLQLSADDYRMFISHESDPAKIAPFYGKKNLARDELKKVEHFLAVTGLEWKQLENLLVQGLSTDEIKGGVAEKFYINAGDKGAAMQISLDVSKTFYEITNLTDLRLDRLQRFIRLAAKMDWSYSSLDTALRSLLPMEKDGEIGKATIKGLYLIRFLQDQSGFSVEEICSFWSDIKTYGRGNGPVPQDPFDKIFNNPSLLNGRDPYKNPEVPFNPDIDLPWNVSQTGGNDGVIRSRLVAALHVDEKDLLLAAASLPALNLTTGVILLNKAAYSLLFRITRAARLFNLKMDAFLLLLKLLYPSGGSNNPLFTSGDLHLTPGQVSWLWEQSQLMKSLPFSIAELDYLLRADTGTYFNPSYDPARLAPMINDLYGESAGVRAGKDSFTGAGIDSQQSELLLEALIENNLLSVDGVVMDDATQFKGAAANFPLTETSFQTDKISAAESKNVFKYLKQSHPAILVASTVIFRGKKGVPDPVAELSAQYNESTNLDFLFALDPDAANKRASVRSVLDDTRRKIQVHLYSFLFPVTAASFESAFIDENQSAAIFSLLKARGAGRQTEIILEKKGADGRPSLFYLNTASIAPAAVESLLTGSTKKPVAGSKKKATHQRKLLHVQYVTRALLEHKVSIEHVVDVMNNLAASQRQTVLNAIANFLNASPEALNAALPDLLSGKDVKTLSFSFLFPLANNQVSSFVLEITAKAAKAMMVFSKLNFAAEEISAVANIPDDFDLDPDGLVSLYSIQRLAAFKKLQSELGNKGNGIVPFLYLPNDAEADMQRLDVLSEITGWAVADILIVVNKIGANYTQLNGIIALRHCFDIVSSTRMTPHALITLSQVANLPVADASRKPDMAVWDHYQAQAGVVQASRGALVTGTVLTEALADDQATNESQKRSVLTPFMIWTLNAEGLPIQTPSDLHQYLLIDVEMGGSFMTSYIAQAISTVQLYLQRCHMGLEKDVTDLSAIPPEWWSWLLSYRLWEANRRIFLYPENYIDPALRKNATSIFSRIKDEMMETNIDAASMTHAFGSYFNGLSELASLVICESYQCQRTVPGIKEPVNTLFIFARTNKQPYVYYYRTCDNGYAWSPWKKIELTIPSKCISPVFCFDRLFIFWTELTSIETSDVKENKSVPISYTTATTKYSFQDTAGNWVPPQSLGEGSVVKYEVDHLIVNPTIIHDVPESLNMKAACWQSPYVLHLKRDPAQILNKLDRDYILVVSGFLEKITASHPQRMNYMIKDPVSPVLRSYIDTLNDYVEFYNGSRDFLKSSQGKDIPSMNISFLIPVMLDGNLNVNRSRIPFENQQPTRNAPLYRPVLKRTGNAMDLGKIIDTNVYSENYYADNLSWAEYNGNDEIELSPLLGKIDGVNASTIAQRNRALDFIFNNGRQVFAANYLFPNMPDLDTKLKLQAPNPVIAGIDLLASANMDYSPAGNFDNLTIHFSRLSTTAVESFSRLLLSGGVESLLTYDPSKVVEPAFSLFIPAKIATGPDDDQLDYDGAYGLYFWETFFHAPFLVAQTLSVNKRFDEARKWYQYVFNPTVPSAGNNNMARFWQFIPFRKEGVLHTNLTRILTNPAQIDAYNNSPYDPDAIARLRISAYAKSVVMKYIDNIIGWADHLFEQDTSEAIAQATQLYLMADNLLGPRPQQVGEFKPVTPRSYNDIKAAYDNTVVLEGEVVSSGKDFVILSTNASRENEAYDGMRVEFIDLVSGNAIKDWITGYDGASQKAYLSTHGLLLLKRQYSFKIYLDGVPEFLVRLENSKPALVKREKMTTNFSAAAYNDINSYFTIPENQEFTGYWNTVEDRLYKIRHSMNKEGQVRTLALYAPPIDPHILVAGGVGSAGASPVRQIPLYRFDTMIDKAKSLVAMLITLGDTLLSVLEKKDAEALSLLRASQEVALLNLNTFVREQNIEELVRMQRSLAASLENATIRNRYYTGLVSQNLSAEEISSIVSGRAAMAMSVASGVIKTLSSIGYSLPQLGSPFAMTYGGAQIGAMLNGISGALDIGTTVSSYISQLSLTMAGYQRRLSDWQHQADLAATDIAQIQSQLEANLVSQEISRKDLANHLASISQSQQVELMLQQKFTNAELYQWMITRISGVYFQSYSLAYDLAMAAQSAYQFELNTDTSFVTYGYWDNLQKGLMAGQGLLFALNQMERSFIDKNIRLLELSKPISLAQLDPLELEKLITEGECTIRLDEKLFDNDFPGHYARKIKSVAISIPAVVGPYQTINATLTQIGNQVVIKPEPNTVGYLLGDANSAIPGPDELRSNWLANQQIALSGAVNDDGLFELNFNDQRYLPFEGTGAVSTWKLKIPKHTNRSLNYQSVSDVIMQLNYTAIDGGEYFRGQVTGFDAMKVYNGSRLYSLAEMFPDRWFAFLQDHQHPEHQVIDVPLTDLLPNFVKPEKFTGFYLELTVADPVLLKGDTSFIDVKCQEFIAPAPAVKAVMKDGVFLYTGHAVDLVAVKGNCQIDFSLKGSIPAGLLKDGFLNPDVVKDVKLILFCDGSLKW